MMNPKTGLSRLLEEVAQQDKEDEAISAQELAAAAETVALPLPSSTREALHGLLAALREEGKEAQGGFGVAAVVEAPEANPQALGLPLPEAAQALGLPTQEDASGYCVWQLAQHPQWIQPDGSLHFTVASSEREEKQVFSFDPVGYIGKMSCQLSMETEHEGTGMLRLRWHADHAPLKGWWVALFLGEQQTPAFDDLLGTDAEGEAVFPAAILGFDPSKTPFRYLVYPR